MRVSVIFAVVAVLLLVITFPSSIPSVAAQPAIIPIGTVQGSVSDTANGLTFRSPFAPPTGNSPGATEVRVQGVIYEKTLSRGTPTTVNPSGNQFGFFLQNTASTADGDPLTSDGIFVFMGRFSTLLRDGGGTYLPSVGDEVVIRGVVTEFFSLTEITSARLVQILRNSVDLEAELPAFETNPPANLQDAYRYWERHEGMRARIPVGSLVVGPREIFASNLDAEVWVIRPDNPLATRSDPYARRVFRDPHPLDDDPSARFDNGNGFRIVMGSHGIKAGANDNTVVIGPGRTFDTLTAPADGGVYFSFNKYQIMVGSQIQLGNGMDPSSDAPVPRYDAEREVRIATFNVENLYDFRDDPTDGCDFAGNSGCPGVNPPFDYVPASQAAYSQKLNNLAGQILEDLHAPDIILIQEAEDQDICHVASTGLSCGGTSHGDGKPDTVQELALVIAGRGGPTYDAADDRDGADDRGIISAYMYRADRVELARAVPGDPVLGTSPRVLYRGTALNHNFDVQNPKALNAVLPPDVDLSTGVDGTNVFTRPVQVALFRVRSETGARGIVDLYILNNHFSSGPNIRVGQRREQAAYNAAVVQALVHHRGPHARIIVGGDLNVFPRPDDPFAPGDALFPSDQLKALYDVGLVNLWDALLDHSPAAAYSYVFEGQAQTLDQLFVTPSLVDVVSRVWAAHVNSDWPEGYAGYGPRGASDHDPQGADFRILPPPIP